MSTLTTAALIASILIASYAVFFFGDRWIHERGEAVASGVLRGIPIPMKQRWLMLFNTWLPNTMGMIFFTLIMSLVFISIARNINDPFLANVTYMCAVFTSLACAFWLVLGTSWFFYYVSVLRESTRS